MKNIFDNNLMIGKTVYHANTYIKYKVLGHWENYVVVTVDKLTPILRKPEDLVSKIPDTISAQFDNYKQSYTYFVHNSDGIKPGDILYSTEYNKMVKVSSVNADTSSARKFFEGVRLGEKV